MPVPAAISAVPNQWIRKISLLVNNEAMGEELADFHMTFRVTATDGQTLNNMWVRVYNLSDSTMKRVRQEYSHVRLEAGYQHGNYAQIFNGTIKQWKRGRENATERYLDIYAADGDTLNSYSWVNETQGPPVDHHVLAAQAQRAAKQFGIDAGPNQMDQALQTAAGTAGVLLTRGKTSVGQQRVMLGELGDSTLTQWSIQNGKLVFYDLQGYLPGEAVELNVNTGLIGQPEQTDNGIMIKCLLNPKLQVAGRVLINNGALGGRRNAAQAITVTEFADPNNPIPFDQFAGQPINLASLADDGLYRVVVIEHVGDTRGNDWYSNITALNLDPSTGKVKLFG
jgi:hypothetical protein